MQTIPIIIMSCLVLVGGGIGCGKTTLINFMLENKKDFFSESIADEQINETTCQKESKSSAKCCVIQFDKLCSIEMQKILMKSLRGLKNFRTDLLLAAERFISISCNCENSLVGPLTERSHDLLTKLISINNLEQENYSYVIFLVEDNFYYRSMRYEWFQIARRTNLGFATIFLHCPLNVAVHRNSSRGYQIPEDRIKKVLSFIELPDPTKYKWEKMSVIFDSSSNFTNLNTSDLKVTIKEASKNPAELVISEEKIKAQNIASKNVIHQSDRILRKLVSKIISNMKADCIGDDDNFKIFISSLINIRQKLFCDIRQGTVNLPEDLVEKIQNLGIESVLNAYEERLEQLFIVTLKEESLDLSVYFNNLHLDE